MIKEVKIEDLEPFRVIDGAFVIDMAFCDDFDMKINSIDKAKEIKIKEFSSQITKEEAKKALEECNGDIAEAILKLSE